MMLSVKKVLIIVFIGVLYAIGCLLVPLFLGFLLTILISGGQQENKLFYGCALAVAMGINTYVLIHFVQTNVTYFTLYIPCNKHQTTTVLGRIL